MTRPSRPSRPRARALVVALVALPVLAVAAPASAHTGIEGAVPADGQALAALPTQVELAFEGSVSQPFVAVTAPDGTSISAGEAAVAGESVVQPLAASAAAGRYTVTYRVVGADGHKVQGTTHFDVTAPAAAAPYVHVPAQPVAVPEPALQVADVVTAAASADDAQGASPVQGVLEGGAAVLLVGAWATWLRRRRTAAASGRG